MSKLLFINSSPKRIEESNPLKLAQFFTECYEQVSPENEVKQLNLYEITLPFITVNMIKAFKNQAEAKTTKTWVEEFKQFNTYLIYSPTWNLSIPAVLKTYMDLIFIPGETYVFDEQEEKTTGLLQNKKMVIISTVPDVSMNHHPELVNMNFPYLKQIFNLMGIENIKHFEIEEDILHPEIYQKHMVILKTQIENFVKSM